MAADASGGSSAFGSEIGSPGFVKVLGAKGSMAMLAVFLFSLAYNVLLLTVPIYILQIYQRVMTSQSSETLFALTIVAVCALGFSVIFDQIRRAVTQRMSHRIYVELGDRVIKKSLSASVDLPDRSRPLADVNTIRQFIGSRDLLSMMDVPFSALFIFVLFLISPILGLLGVAIAILMLLLAIISAYTSNKRQMVATNRMKTSEDQFSRFAEGGALVHSLCMSEPVRRSWLRSQLAFSEDIRVAGRSSNVTQGFSQGLRTSAQVLAIATAAYLALSAQVNPGMILAASILMSRAVNPIEGVIMGRIRYITARDAYARVSRLLSGPEQTTLLERKPNSGRIVAEGLVYVPRGGRKRQPVVRGATLNIEPNEIMAIIGPNASGKSILSQLLIGAMEPNSGTVQLDGADIHSYARDALAETIGYLPQVSDVLPGSIADNISRFREPDVNAIWDALRAVDLENEVGNFQDRLDTPMLTASYLLTPGQYRRLLLARAVYGNPSLLVLDEPNQNMDQASDKLVASLVESLKEKGAAVVLISPRDALMRTADRVMLMRGGVIEPAESQQDQQKARAGGMAAAPGRPQGAPGATPGAQPFITAPTTPAQPPQKQPAAEAQPPRPAAPVYETAQPVMQPVHAPAQPARGQAQQPSRGQAQQPSRGQAQQPPRGQAQQPPRGQAQQPPRGQAQQPPRGQAQQPPRGQAQQPPRGPAQSEAGRVPTGQPQRPQQAAPAPQKFAGPRPVAFQPANQAKPQPAEEDTKTQPNVQPGNGRIKQG